jgi:hypothetical protein
MVTVMVLQFYGSTVPYSSIVLWFSSSMVTWFYSFMVLYSSIQINSSMVQ